MQKTAIITGSTKGIGLAIAQSLLSRGCKVILNYAHDDQEANRLNIALKEQHGPDKFIIIKADLSTHSGLEQFTTATHEFSQTFDYLILNTAITDKTPFQEITTTNWHKVIDTNLNIPFFLVQRFSPKMQDYGKIIFIGAILGIYPHAMSISYGVSKAAVHFLARSLVKEFADRKITVNVIAPGFVNTPWQKDKQPEHRKRVEDKIALGRFAEDQEIAHMVSAVLDNDYINGAIIQMDGGYCYK